MKWGGGRGGWVTLDTFPGRNVERKREKVEKKAVI